MLISLLPMLDLSQSHEVKGSVLVTGKASEILLEEKSNSDGLYVYASKQVLLYNLT